MYSQGELKRITLDMLKNEELKVKTIEQSEPNWKYDLSLEGISFPEGVNATLIYGRLELINGILFFVSSLKLENTTENNISINDVVVNINNMPAEIGSKIYDILGKKVSESIDLNTLITEYSIFKSNRVGTASNVIGRMGNNQSANSMYVRLANSNTLNAGDTQYFTARTFLTIL